MPGRRRPAPHGLTGTRLYRIWKQIRPCPQWEDPAEFVRWATANGYREDRDLIRDGRGIFAPENCRWMDRHHRLAVDGETKTVAEWSRDQRSPVRCYKSILARLRRIYSEEDAVLLPPDFRPSHKPGPVGTRRRPRGGTRRSTAAAATSPATPGWKVRPRTTTSA